MFISYCYTNIYIHAVVEIAFQVVLLTYKWISVIWLLNYYILFHMAHKSVDSMWTVGKESRPY